MLDDFHSYHGSAITELINTAGKDLRIGRIPTMSSSSYVVNESSGLFIKYTTRRHSPWSFTFNSDQVKELRELAVLHRETFIALVCGRSHVAVSSLMEFAEVLDIEKLDSGTVSVSTRHGRMLQLRGSSGQMSHKLPKTEPFKKLLDSTI